MYKLIIIWYTGEKETYDYTTREESRKRRTQYENSIWKSD